MRGAAHKYSYPHHYTGRPQVARADDVFMNRLMTGLGTPLINTSFNFHGKPIALDMDSIVENHVLQYARNQNVFTVVINNE